MRILPIIAFLGFVGIIDTSIISPVISNYAVTLGANESIASFIAGLYSLIAIIVSFPLGYLVDRIGRRRALLIGIPGDVLAMLFYAFAPNYIFLMFARSIHALFDSMILPSSIAIIGDQFKRLGKPLSLYWTFTAISIILGSIASIVIVSTLGFSPIFLFVLIFHFIAFLLIYRLRIPEVAGKAFSNSTKTIRLNYRILLPAYFTMFSVYLINGAIVGILGPALTTLANLPREAASARVGSVLAVTTLIGIPSFFVSSWICEKFRPTYPLLLASLGSIITSSLLYSNLVNFYLIPSSIVLGITLGLAFVASSYVTASIGEEARGTATGILQAFSLAGVFIGAASAGMIAEVYGYNYSFLVPIAPSILAFILSLLASLGRRQQLAQQA